MWSLYYASRVVGLVTFSLDPANKFAPTRSWLDLVHVGVVGGVLATTTVTLLVQAVTAKGRGFCLMKLPAASASALPLCLGAASAILLNVTRNLPVFRKLAGDVTEIVRRVPPSRGVGRGWLAAGAGTCMAASYAALRGWYVGRLVAEGDVDAKVAAVYAYAGMVDLVLNLQFDAFQLFLVGVTRRLRGRVQRLLVGKRYLDSDVALLPGPDPGVYHVKTRPAWTEDRDQLWRLQNLYDAWYSAALVAVDAVKFPLLLSVVHHLLDALWHLYLALLSPAGWLLHCACALSHLSLLLVACVLVHLVVVEAQGLAACCSRLLLVAEFAALEDEVLVLLNQLLCCRPHVTLCGMVKVDTKLFGGVVATLCTYLLLLYTYGIAGV